MGLRGRFTVWFALAALVPIAVAALVTSYFLAKSFRDSYAEQRVAAEQAVQAERRRLEQAVVDAVGALANDRHPATGGRLVEMAKHGSLPPGVADKLRRSDAEVMSGLGLDVLFVVDRADTVLSAPHYSAANDERAPVHRSRARALAGRPYYVRERLLRDGEVRTALVVASARTLVDEARGQQLTVVGGRVVGGDLLRGVRQRGLVEARVTTGDGDEVLVPADDDWARFASGAPIEVALPGPDGAAAARVQIAVSEAALHLLLGRVTQTALLLAGAALLITTLLGFVVARGMTRDLDALVTGAQAASRGELEHRVPVGGRDEIGAVAAAFNTMMSDFKDARERLVRAERIAAWQEIARRLAHEIKNPLTPIQMSVETMRKTWKGKHPSFDEIFAESTATVLEEVTRLKRIVSEFSEFSRLPKPDKRRCDLNEVAAGALALYRSTVAVVEDLAADLPAIEADRDQLHQVVLNLLENARDALAGRGPGEASGRILLATRRLDGGVVQLAVEDNGPGIPAGIKDKLFTPYFTTKQGKGGTGLGLAIAHRIVTDHGGRIVAADAPTGGARFVIELPGGEPGVSP